MKKIDKNIKELIIEEETNTVLSKEEEYQQLIEFNQTKVQYNKNKTIHQLFEEQVEKTPNNIAVVYEDKELTYKELNEKANQLAHHLIDQGIKADDLVAICIDRSLEMIVGLLAILKSGGAYVPIDPNYPKDRIEYMVTNSNAKVLLTQEFIKNSLPKTDSINICIDTFDLSSYLTTNTITNTKSNNLAYVIYTSGSTGRPKGVMVEHMGIVNRLNWMQEKFCITKEDKVVQKTPFSFDVSVWELFWPLIVGSIQIIAKPNGHKDNIYLIDLIKKHNVSIIHFVPSMLNIMLENLKFSKLNSLKHIICSGEALSTDSVIKHYKNSTIAIHNLYGPTEASIDVSYYDCEISDKLTSIPIGRPINNTQLYILDKQNQLVPKGVEGELHISGDGLARGYLNQPELTKEKFIPNPYIENEQMYKTGDLVKYLEDGNIEYIGRIDDQVKIRGFRIELGEIEQQLLLIDKIKKSVVIAKEDSNGYKSLVGFIIVNEEIDLQDIKLELLKHLPDYMIPSAIVTIDTLPLTPNGKTDKKALAKLDVHIESSHEYVAPRDELEEKLAIIFSEILNIEKIGIYDNFFELGGNSLLGVILISKINNLLNLSLQIAILFKASTVQKLTNIINTKEQSSILVEIQTKGTNVPIYAIPGIVGSSLLFKTLSHELGETQPFYGLDIIPNRNCDAKFATAKETAKTNILAIKSIQPNGPYRLIGFCAGGTIAFEMAKLLKKEIDSVILLNAFPNKTKKTFSEQKNIIIEIAKYKFKCKLSCLEKNIFFNFAKKLIIRYSNIHNRVYNKMCYRYFNPEPINEKLDISLFSVDGKNSKQNWANLIKYDITEIKVDGDNETLLNQTNAPSLSKKINSYYASLNKKV